MNGEELVLLRCEFWRSGFDVERVFEVNSPEGRIHIGAAPVMYCFNADRQPLDDSQPARRGESIEGWLTGRKIGEKDGKLLVYVPDGEVLLVDPDLVIPFPAEALPHVLV